MRQRPTTKFRQVKSSVFFGNNFLPGGRADAVTFAASNATWIEQRSGDRLRASIPLYSVFPGQINAQLPFECPHPEPRN